MSSPVAGMAIESLTLDAVEGFAVIGFIVLWFLALGSHARVLARPMVRAPVEVAMESWRRLR